MYPQRYQPDHPRADVRGMVALHVLIVEKLLGREVPKGTIIHHRDWDKTHNPEDGSNYELMTRAEHQRLPEWQGRFLAEKGLLDEFFEWWRAKKADKNADEERTLRGEIIKRENELERRKRYQK